MPDSKEVSFRKMDFHGIETHLCVLTLMLVQESRVKYATFLFFKEGLFLFFVPFISLLVLEGICGVLIFFYASFPYFL